jgi:hypothetical protein
MPQARHTNHADKTTLTHIESGVTPMTKLIYRNKHIYGLAVLALLVLSSGAGVKWN